ncbi:Metallo-dependent phosphatase-like protein [Dunaliella salina]|uniref:Metallo-dependent phosphatase-like protein n=1 Tax=Dunaliella salina TaxID=3046 RepID=A0ABQ7H124_DUNSA|nr:Metallo-dependent phosphatase-like protein [Dunaliella salina]|eukprot:KAF5840550.1 Metallo-dependent phosphatase-like protein [Dunaliella salina]
MLYNMRWDFHFKLIRGGYKKPTIVAEAPPIKNEIPNAPTSGHLALHADQKSVVVQWVSAAPYPQVVEFSPQLPSSPEQPHMAAAAGHGENMHQDVTSQGVDAIRSCEAAAASASAGGSAANEGFGVLTEGALAASVGVTAGGNDLQEMYTNVGGSGIRPDSAQPVTCINPLGGSSYQFRATSFRDTYRPSDMCGFPATSVGFIDPGYIHTVVMSHKLLQPGKRYYYRYGNGLHFAENYGQNSSLLATHLASGAEKDANLALMTGDLAYALGYAADWDVFGSQFEKAFTQWPMAVGTGNHERDFPGTGDAFGYSARDSGGECNVPFMWRWYSPANIHRNPFKSFYSFNMGPVHILMLDSEIPSDPSSDQGRFVAQDLASVDRELTPWVVASLHRMMSPSRCANCDNQFPAFLSVTKAMAIAIAFHSCDNQLPALFSNESDGNCCPQPVQQETILAWVVSNPANQLASHQANLQTSSLGGNTSAALCQ